MPSSLNHWLELAAPLIFRLLGILIIVLVLNRLLRALTRLLVQPATSPTRAAQLREQQARTLSGVLYSAASKIVWAVAILIGLKLFGYDLMPAITVAGLAGLAVGFGAQSLVKDIISGFYIVLEDQYVVGDTIQFGEIVGRVEHLTLRRTVLRDLRGGLVTISNGEMRTVSNLSRDWSQTQVDISLSPDLAIEKTMQILEAASASLRDDPAWSQTLVDGPRVLGLQTIDRLSSTVRLQVRTLPTRQDEVARELRRRIQLEFQRRGIPLSAVQRIELAAVSHLSQDVALSGSET